MAATGVPGGNGTAQKLLWFITTTLTLAVMSWVAAAVTTSQTRLHENSQRLSTIEAKIGEMYQWMARLQHAIDRLPERRTP